MKYNRIYGPVKFYGTSPRSRLGQLEWLFGSTGFDVLLEEPEDKDGEGGEGDVVEGQVDAVVQRLGREAAEEGEEELGSEGGHVLVKEILKAEELATSSFYFKQQLSDFSSNFYALWALQHLPEQVSEETWNVRMQKSHKAEL